ncbi:unnamed protein product, partial [Closterium sp. Naga37s-1]
MNGVLDLIPTVPLRPGRDVSGQRSLPSSLKSRLLTVTALPVALFSLLLLVILPLCASSAFAEPVRGGLLQRSGHVAAADRETVREGSVEEGRAKGGRRGLQQQPGGSVPVSSPGEMSNSGAASGGTSAGAAGTSPPTSSSSGNNSGGSISGTGNATAVGNATGAGAPTGAGNLTGAAGNGTEGGAVRYFTVGQEAFVWGSPLVTFFRQQATRAALNAFSFANTTAVVGTTTVALPNVDTVYGGAFLYLRDQPMVFKTPNMGQGRYYSIGFFQTYGPAFSVNGSRANGPGPNTFTLVGPNWAGELPGDLAPTAIRSPTNDALLLMRVVVSENVSNDIATVLDLYSQVSLQSLSEALGGPAVAPLPNPPLPSSNLSEALQRMTLIGDWLQRDPPLNNSANNRVVRMLASINVTQQYGFDPYSVTQQQAAALEAAMQTTDTLITAANVVIQINDSLIQSENFWAASTTLLGHDFETEFLYRATLTAPGGIGGLPPTEVVYFLTFLAVVTPSVAAVQPAATNASNTTTPPTMPPTSFESANATASPVSSTAGNSSTMSNIRAENTTTTASSDTTANSNTTGTQPSPRLPSIPSPPANNTISLQPQPSSIFPSSIPLSSMPSPRRPFTRLQGSRCYRLRLTPPPVDSFWSVTIYNASNLNLLEGVNKFGVGDRTPGLIYNPDGTLTIYIQSTPPGQSLEANWIPTVNS